MKGLVETLRREITRHKATLLVLDGLVSAEETASSPRDMKKFVHELQTQASLTDCTTYLLTSAYMGQQLVSAEHTMVDGIFDLQSRLHGRRAERELVVHKFRGSSYLRGVHSFRITDTGIAVYPRVEALFAHPSGHIKADGPFLSLGVGEIDNMLGGGVKKRSTTLVMGPAGTGKTTLGLQFLGAPQAGRGLFFSFNESPAALQAKAAALGLPIAGLMNSGDIQTLWQPVTEALLDEVCARLINTVREGRIERLFLDGADGLGKLTTEQHRISPVLTALSNELRSLAVTTLSTAETDFAGIVPGQPFAGLSVRDLSPIAENIILFRHATTLSETHRMVSVVKARDALTDMRFRRYEIGPAGIKLDPDHTRAEEILSQIARGRDGGLRASPPLADPLGRGD
ncbi:MAG: serine/threonine protein phosphatase [Methylobacteriaceae bacterium]|nr:serine/threonine protein phosphatase [Methylobacteriaceae bacterium]